MVVIKVMNYNEIPEGSDQDLLDDYLDDFFKNHEYETRNYGVLHTLDQLSLIAEKYSYYRLDNNKKKIISDYIIANIDYNDYYIMEVVTFIIVNFELIDTLDFIIENIDKVSDGISQMLLEAKDEL